MKSLVISVVAVLVALVSASPVLPTTSTIVQSRDDVSTSANEFYQGGCRDVILFFARGTIQSGNIGEMPGPDLVSQLKTALGEEVVAAQGVNYPADIFDNLLPDRTNLDYANELGANITKAASQCPDAKFVVSGYSQGAAVVHGALPGLSNKVKAQIAAAVTFGDTMDQQDGGRITNFDTSKTLILCNDGDLVCDGTVIVTSAHLDYTDSVPGAVSFIQSKLA